MAVKLNGETAKTNPSSGRCSIRFHMPGPLGLLGQDLGVVVGVEAEEVDRLGGAVDLGLVAGLALAEHRRGVQDVAVGPARSSAAFRKIATRSSHGIRDQTSFARSAAFTASATSSGPARWTSARTCPWVVRHHRLRDLPRPDLLPADDEGDLDPLRGHLGELLLEARALGLPGA